MADAPEQIIGVAPETGLRQIFTLGWQIFLRDYHSRYRRALLAIVWILSPLAAITGTASLVAGSLGLKSQPGEAPYALFAATGLVLWGLFSDTVTGPQQMCRRCRGFLRRAPFPPEAILVANLCYVLMNFCIKAVPLAVMFALCHVPLQLQAGLAVIFALALLATGTAIGALIAPLSMIYNDVRHGIGMVVGGLLLATPVLYHVPASGLRHDLSLFNPLAWLLTPARDLLLTGNTAVLADGVLVAIILPLVLLPLALVYFRAAIKLGITHL